jgi:N-acetylglutamate synthase-like GNAT family acetyltransferase
MTDLTLRPATKTDAAKIRDLIHRVGINPLDLNWEHFLVAETTAGDFIGCAQLKPHRDGSVELASLAVEEASRGRGAARALIERLLAEGPRPLFLMCRPELGVLYERFGFRPAAEPEMTPYFRRIRRLFRLLRPLTGMEGPLIMRLDRP